MFNVFYVCIGTLVIHCNVYGTDRDAAKGTAFRNSCFSEILFGNEVAEIGDYAFSGCETIQSIVIGNNVKNVGKEAFKQCTKLKHLLIPSGANVYYSAFSGCYIIDDITVVVCDWISFCNDTVTQCFHTDIRLTDENGNEYTTAIIPNNVTDIGNCAFRNCTGLTCIEIPNSVMSIGSGAFQNCTGLTSFEIPNSVISIGSGAFQNCTGLTSFEIPNSVKSIGNTAFSGCSSLVSVAIQNSVKSIGEYAFVRCKIETITIPKEVESIGTGAFSD